MGNLEREVGMEKLVRDAGQFTRGIIVVLSKSLVGFVRINVVLGGF